MTKKSQSDDGLADRLCESLAAFQSVAVAFSGGVDSAVVAAAAFRVLRDQAIAVTAISPSLAATERKIARQVAHDIGIRHLEVETDELDSDEYRANRGDRCFHCKTTLYRRMLEGQKQWNADVLLNGTNADDLSDHRPGLVAAQNFAVRSPLAELKFGKADVRRLATFWNLRVADKPASPCLSSRIAYGVEVTEERLQMVERAEEAVRSLLNLSEFRVRCEDDDLARLEVPVDRLADLIRPPERDQLVDRLTALGFRSVTVDLAGFRSGSFNDRLTDPSGSLVPLNIPPQS